MPTLIKSGGAAEEVSEFYADKRGSDWSGTGSWSVSVVQDAWYAIVLVAANNSSSPGIHSGLTSQTWSDSFGTTGTDYNHNSTGYLVIGKTTGTSITFNGYTNRVRMIRVG